MHKFQVTIQFEMNETFMSHVPEHQAYIDELIRKNVVEHYAVSMESYRLWILMNAESKEAILDYLSKSPLYQWWTIEVDSLFVYDGKSYRLPELVLN